MKYSLAIAFSLLLLLTACKEDALLPDQDLTLITLAVTDISETGAVFNSRIINPEQEEIKEHGFIWQEGESPNFRYSNRKIVGGAISTEHFSATITSTLKPYKKYFVRSYIKVGDKTTIGTTVEFTSLGSNPPEFLSINPAAGVRGDTVEIRGKNFSFTEAENEVLFGEAKAKIIHSSDTLILAEVPARLNTNEEVKVKVATTKLVVEQSFPFTYTIPKIHTVSPTTAAFGDTVTITGENFRRAEGTSVTLFYNDWKKWGAEVISVTTNEISFIVPSNLQVINTDIKVVSSGIEVIATSQFSLEPPAIHSLSPDTIHSTQETITIYGDNFSPVKENISVYFRPSGSSGYYSAIIESATFSTIQFTLTDNEIFDDSTIIEVVVVTIDRFKPSEPLSIYLDR